MSSPHASSAIRPWRGRMPSTLLRAAPLAVVVALIGACSAPEPTAKKAPSVTAKDKKEATSKRRVEPATSESPPDETEAPPAQAPTTCAEDAECNAKGRICAAGSCVKGCR